MSDKTTIKASTEPGSVDASVPLAEIRWYVQSARRRKKKRKLPKKSVEDLREHGIVTLGDLHGLSQSDFLEYYGIGSTWAERIVMAANAAEGVHVRTPGFPDFVDVSLPVPFDMIDSVAEHDSDEVREAVQRAVKDEVFEEVETLIVQSRIENLEEQRQEAVSTEQEISNQIRELKQQLEG